jgi:hypothetical protein
VQDLHTLAVGVESSMLMLICVFVDDFVCFVVWVLFVVFLFVVRRPRAWELSDRISNM